MIEIWMKSHLESDNNRNIVKNRQLILGLHFSVGVTTQVAFN
jgi:hypothetical protein